MGGAFGVNCVVAISEYRTAFHADAFTATQTSENILSGELIQRIQRLLAEGGITIEGQQSGAIDYLGAVIHAQAATLGYQDAFLIICFVFIATLIPAWVLKKTM